jgi:hypothetical protein
MGDSRVPVLKCGQARRGEHTNHSLSVSATIGEIRHNDRAAPQTARDKPVHETPNGAGTGVGLAK